MITILMNITKQQCLFCLPFFDPNVILRIIISPNSAFAQIRDNEGKYFVQSIGIFVVASVLSVLIMMPFVMIPLDERYFEGVDAATFSSDELDPVLFVAISLLSVFISTVLLYFIGKKLGGNTNWKKVFSVFFHANVPTIPMSVVLSILIFLMMDSFASIDPSSITGSDIDEEQVLSIMGPVLAYVGLLIIFTIVFVVWIFVVSVKAVKTVNGFGTAKAFGLIILIMIISSVITAPFGM